MTLAAATPVNSYVGTGGANSYPFTFPIFTQNTLYVSVEAPSPSTSIYVLTLGTDYTVSGLPAAGGPASGGTITLVNNSQAWLTAGFLTTGWTLIVERVVPLEQNTSIRNQGDFYQESIENALDYLMMAIQQLQVEQSATTPAPGNITIINGVMTMADTINGHTYQLVMIDGALTSLLIS